MRKGWSFLMACLRVFTRTTLQAPRVCLGLAVSLTWATPAWACLSCSCGGSGTSGDLGAVGGTASLFSMGSRWLLQQGVSGRSITGSFNELGGWSPTPVDGSLQTLQGTLGVTYFPFAGASLGVQLPMLANSLDKATWGPMGSVAPTDLPRATGVGLGDVALQASYKVVEGDAWALAAWGGAGLPTGTSTGAPEALSGAGVYSGQAGLVGLSQLGDWELTANLGYQRPFGRPPLSASTFYVGEAWLYQLQGNYRLNDTWRVGLGLSGYAGDGRFGANDLAVPMRKLKLVPSVQHAFNWQSGVRLALGYDPAALGANSMTDLSVYAVFYQFVP